MTCNTYIEILMWRLVFSVLLSLATTTTKQKTGFAYGLPPISEPFGSVVSESPVPITLSDRSVIIRNDVEFEFQNTQPYDMIVPLELESFDKDDPSDNAQLIATAEAVQRRMAPDIVGFLYPRVQTIALVNYELGDRFHVVNTTSEDVAAAASLPGGGNSRRLLAKFGNWLGSLSKTEKGVADIGSTVTACATAFRLGNEAGGVFCGAAIAEQLADWVVPGARKWMLQTSYDTGRELGSLAGFDLVSHFFAGFLGVTDVNKQWVAELQPKKR